MTHSRSIITPCMTKEECGFWSFLPFYKQTIKMMQIFSSICYQKSSSLQILPSSKLVPLSYSLKLNTLKRSKGFSAFSHSQVEFKYGYNEIIQWGPIKFLNIFNVGYKLTLLNIIGWYYYGYLLQERIVAYIVLAPSKVG